MSKYPNVPPGIYWSKDRYLVVTDCKEYSIQFYFLNGTEPLIWNKSEFIRSIGRVKVPLQLSSSVVRDILQRNQEQRMIFTSQKPDQMYGPAYDEWKKQVHTFERQLTDEMNSLLP